MASRAPWYCRYGIHGDLEKEVNVDGTVVYRTRERPCVCTPPRPCSRALPLAHPRPHPPPMRGRPAVPRAAPQRQRTSSRITGTEREDVVPPWETAHVPLPDSSPSCHSDEMVGTRLHVLVPPLALDSAVGDFYAGYVSSMSHRAAATLPHVPVISPLATVETETPFTVVTAPLEMGRCVDSLPVGMSPAPQLPAQEVQPAAATEQLPGAPPQENGSGNPQSSPTPLLQQDLLPPPASPSAAEVAAPAPPCNAESHAVDQRCGFVYCPACGVRVAAPAPSASEAVQYPPTMCPMAPHMAAGEEHGSQAGGVASVGRFCFLCGIDKQAPACKTEASMSPPLPLPPQQPLDSTGGCMANAPATGEAGARKALPPSATCENAAAVASATTASPLPPVQDTSEVTSRDPYFDQDLRIVDAVISRMLRNAAENNGRVRPPCGLPQCRLCDPSAASATPPLTASPLTWACPPWHCGCWGMQPVMCGSPAVAIIHHHYAK